MLIRPRCTDDNYDLKYFSFTHWKCVVATFFHNRVRGISHPCFLTSSFSISFIMNVFLTKMQHLLLLSLYTANHFCHSSISLSYIVHFLLPRARFLSVCLITSRVKSGTQMKSKLCTHVSDPEVLRDPVAPFTHPTSSLSFSRFCQGSRGEEEGWRGSRIQEKIRKKLR